MLIPTFTEDYRQQQLALGRQSLWYFMTGICGLTADDEETGEPTVGQFHEDLCSFLEGRAPHHPYNQAVVCCSRGLGKSNCVRIYVLWRGLYIVNFSALVVSNSADNAQALYLDKIYQLLRDSRRSEYLQWLYRERLKDGWDRNTTELNFTIDDPMAEPALTCAGIATKIESKHPHVVVIDDPEGADAEKGLAVNEDSYNAYLRAIPLLKTPKRSQLIVVATPWGPKPLVYRLRDQCGWKTEADNIDSEIKFFWRTAITDAGESAWPERFPLPYLETIKKNRKLWHTQYMLGRPSEMESIFDIKAVRESAYEWASPDCDVIRYRGFKFDPDKLDDDGFIQPEPTVAQVRLAKLRYYIHFDPLHRTAEMRRSRMTKQRPAKAAIAVVGIAPDYHAFLVKYWTDANADLHQQATQLMRFYRIYCPFRVTWESVGGQVWLLSHVKAMEDARPDWKRPKSAGVIFPPMDLPRLSARLIEGEKTIESKEMMFREGLSPWLNHGVFHFHRTEHEIPLGQLENAFNEDHEVDIIDCLAQGPGGGVTADGKLVAAPIWKPPAGEDLVRDWNERKRYVETFVAKVGGWRQRSGFVSPWRG